MHQPRRVNPQREEIHHRVHEIGDLAAQERPGHQRARQDEQKNISGNVKLLPAQIETLMTKTLTGGNRGNRESIFEFSVISVSSR
ncbi:MAG: hypothetical protein ABFD69_04595 [Candidatus Sumerlaeia bacterium]